MSHNTNNPAAEAEAEAATYKETNEAANQAAGEEQAGASAQESAEAGAALSPEQQEIQRLTQLADENYQKYLRTQADFDNFRRRSRQEKEDFAKYASLKVIEQLLPVVDNFERALAAGKNAQDMDQLVKGLDMIYRQLDQLLQNEGVTPIASVGAPFDPSLHQAVMQVESNEHDSGTVLEELQRGYMMKDKIIRPAMVKVSG